MPIRPLLRDGRALALGGALLLVAGSAALDRRGSGARSFWLQEPGARRALRTRPPQDEPDLYSPLFLARVQADRQATARRGPVQVRDASTGRLAYTARPSRS